MQEPAPRAATIYALLPRSGPRSDDLAFGFRDLPHTLRVVIKDGLYRYHDTNRGCGKSEPPMLGLFKAPLGMRLYATPLQEMLKERPPVLGLRRKEAVAVG